ncbi:TetR family transcriptional regulator [Streptomyces sp. NPDC015242]|uniref:TetR family transcriptional regulator n=1 Tax=Streptomyces sp. NPDC015242 TaxID=3364951 RepID=UPI0036F8F06E
MEEGGSEAGSTRAVAAAAGITAPALYRMFDDKDGLLTELAAYGFEMYLAEKREALALTPDDPVADLYRGWGPARRLRSAARAAPPGSGRGPRPAGDTAGPGGRRRAPSGSGGAGDSRHPRRDDRCHAGTDRRRTLGAGPDRFGTAAGHRPRLDHYGPARLIRVGPGLARTRPPRRAGNRARHQARSRGLRGALARHRDGAAPRMAPATGRLSRATCSAGSGRAVMDAHPETHTPCTRA